MNANEPERGGQPRGEDECAGLRRELGEAREQSLRLLADLDNFRRRSAREHEMARAEGRRAAATYRLLLGALRAAGAEPVESKGRPFDPNVHEAVATVPSGDVEPGTVAHEVRRGWRLGDDLLRPAQVVVAAAPEPAERWR